MAAPVISNFGDENHEEGETGLTVSGFQFSHFAGELWMHQNNSVASPGNTDQLTVGTWADMQLSGVEIPASPNNATGTVFLFVKTENDEWSLPYTFTLSAAGGGGGGSLVHLYRPPMHKSLRRMMR